MDYAMYSRVIIGVCIVVGILLVLLLGRGTRQKDRHVSTGGPARRHLKNGKNKSVQNAAPKT